MNKSQHTVLTPLVSLDTPGKATVHVVILADPVSQLVVDLVSSVDPLFPTLRMA